MHVRLNVTLPEDTVKRIDRIARKRGRSRFIDRAVKHYMDEMGRAHLRKRMKEGAIARAERDLSLVEGWFILEEEAWPRNRR